MRRSGRHHDRSPRWTHGLDMGRAEPLDDQVFVVLTGEGLVVKRLRRWDDSRELNRDNPSVRIPGRYGPGANPRSARVDGATVRWTAPSRQQRTCSCSRYRTDIYVTC